MKIFWDIESYTNLFCAAFIDEKNALEMFYIVNSAEDEGEVIRACKDSGYPFKTFNLTKNVERFKWHFEKRIPKPAGNSLLSDFLGVEDKPVEPKENIYIGYNTLNYDIQMIDYLLNSMIANRVQTTTETLRKFSDTLINDTARRINTKPYEQYANQVDAAFLNEKMVERGRPTIGLKTLVGIKGGSIIESESNKTGYSKSIYDDVLYNINDVTELRDAVFPGIMQSTLDIRLSLLDRFPKLRENGVTPNSTSAKFVEFIVSPDQKIADYPTVSFMYPAPHIAKKLGVEQKDILEYAKDWYMKNVYEEIKKRHPHAANRHLAKFMSVYNLYSSVRGQNWNDSTTHLLEHGIPARPKSDRRKLMDTFGTFLPFIDRNGVDSYTYANFSLGGIHGAEVNHHQLKKDRALIAELKEKYKVISAIPKGKVSAKLMNLIKFQSRTSYKGYPNYLSHEIPLFVRETEMVDEIVDPEDFTPYQYDKTSGAETLIDRYKYTSTGFSVHQDFAGYYPMLLINMGAFYDGNGTDNYADVYNFRISVKGKLKHLKFNSPEWIVTNIEQEGYKLILNSASGVLDGSFDTNLRANNKAMSMRIIGQLMTYIIGQRLALESARIPSSNTDGIYVFDIEEELNKKLVDEELEQLYVQIDPEPVYFVSKDSNNRLELEIEDGSYKVVSARGGTLTSWGGARVDNRLNHPALVDLVLTRYLQNDHIADKEISPELIRQALDESVESIITNKSKRDLVIMASWVMRSTSGSIFIDNHDVVYPGTIRTWLSNSGVTLERYGTRKTKVTKSIEAHSKQLFPDVKIGDPEVVSHLTELGLIDKYFTTAALSREVDSYKQSGESLAVVAKMKISNLPENAKLHIDNSSLLTMSDEDIENIYKQLDFDSYVELIAKYAKVWHNTLVD